MSLIISNHKLNTTYDSTGSIATQDKWTQSYQSESKQGWRKYYMDALNIYDVCNSNLENRMARHLIESIKKGFVLEIDYKALMKSFDISDKKAKTFLKKMKDIGFIKGGRGLYLTNPFMYIPYQTNDKDVAEAQTRWNQ